MELIKNKKEVKDYKNVFTKSNDFKRKSIQSKLTKKIYL